MEADDRLQDVLLSLPLAQVPALEVDGLTDAEGDRSVLFGPRLLDTIHHSMIVSSAELHVLLVVMLIRLLSL